MTRALQNRKREVVARNSMYKILTTKLLE